MADQFVAEIRIVGFNFAPTGWATCDGQLLPISQNTALFSLLGTTYGGNGKSTFALPNLQGSVPLHPGQGPGLSQYYLGQTGGSASVTLLQTEMPVHTHGLMAVAGFTASDNSPLNNVLGKAAAGLNAYAPAPNQRQMAFQAIQPTGGSQPHNNMMPYLVLTFVIAMQGIFPPRG